MKKYCAYITLLIILLLPKANAQDEIDYEDDINPYFIGDSIELIIPKLVEFFETHASHPASNLQLARIYEQRFKESDYLIDYDAAIKNAERAQLLYDRALAYVDDKEIRKNEWYYPNFTDEFKRNGKPILSLEKIQQEIKRGKNEADSFLLHMPAIHDNFMKMVAKYDLAAKTFVRINGDFNSLKDIFLLYDAALEGRFDLLKDSYDSTLYYYDAYKQAASKYPPFKVSQNLKVKPINTYRLDGLVIQTDFFRPLVDIWDYSQWVEGLKNKIENEIKGLRVDIDKMEQILSNSLMQIKNSSRGDSISLDPISSKEIFKIRKYDLNSPVANLFQYKDDKLDLLFDKQALKKFDTLSAVSSQLKLYAYNNLFQKLLKSQEDTKVYQRELSRSNLQKNVAFYEKYYNGKSGVEQYFIEEANWVKRSTVETADSINKLILTYYANPFLEEPLTYRRKKLVFYSPLSISDTLKSDINRVNRIRSNVNKLWFLSGYYFNKDSVRQTFMAAKKAGKVLWYQNQLPLEEGATEWQQIGGISLVSGGNAVFSLYRRNVDSLNFKNTLIKMNTLGKVENTIQVDTENQPVYISGLRNTEEQLAFYQGDGFDKAVWPTKITIVKFHPDSTNYLMNELDINGLFVGFVELEEDAVFISKSKDGQSIFLTKVDENFKVGKKQSLQFDADQYFQFVYKISEESIHVVSEGAKGHIVINDNLELKYTKSELR